MHLVAHLHVLLMLVDKLRGRAEGHRVRQRTLVQTEYSKLEASRRLGFQDVSGGERAGARNTVHRSRTVLTLPLGKPQTEAGFLWMM